MKRYKKCFKFYVGYDLLWFVKPLVNKFTWITGYAEGYD